MPDHLAKLEINRINRRFFIGGSDARIIMGDNQDALMRLWRQKRGEIEPEDLSGNLVVQLGRATEELNRQYRTGDYRHSEASPTSGAALDGSDLGWPGAGQ